MSKTEPLKKLKPIDYELVSELIKNSRLSDRQVAKKMNVSQPTVTRRRGELEKQKLLDYTSIPDMKKLGFEILAFTFGKWRLEMVSDQKIEAAKAFLSRHPNVIFVSTGGGMGFDRVAVSFHRNYSDYSLYMKELKEDWKPFLGQPETFIVSLQSDNILRNLTFKYLAELFKKEIAQQKT